MKPWQFILLGLLCGLVAAGLVLLIASPSARISLTVAQSTQSASIQVDVDGSVLHPGVYTLQIGDRINDAIQAAGGLTNDSDTTGINLAAYIKDGQKILVPGNTHGSSSPVASDAQIQLLNLNSATLDELVELPGIGEQKANAIIEYRSTYGDFASLEDLLYVPGIGQSLLDTIRNYVTVGK